MGNRRHWLLFLAGALALIPACSQVPPAAKSQSPPPTKSTSAVARNAPVPADQAAEQGDFEDSTSSSCGVERWSIKTGTDAGAKKINIKTGTATTLAKLVSIKPPGTIPPNSRVPGTETTNWQIHVTLVEYKLESDSDYHLVIKSGKSTMIAEIPSPSCVAAGSPFKADITASRAAFDKKYHVTTSWQTANIPVVITGIGFFDYKHGQTGVAPNAIEVHPLLDITFGKAAVAPFAMTVAQPTISIGQGSRASVTVGSAVRGRPGAPGSLRFVGLPRGITASVTRGTWVPNWAASSTSLPSRLYPSRVTFDVSPTAAPGDYPIRIYGTAAGSILWTQVLLTVVDGGQPDFYLAATPATFDVARGHSGSLRIDVLPLNGYDATTYFAINGLPPGVTATLAPGLARSGRGSFVIRVSVSNSSLVGTHAITVGAASGSQAHILLLALHVTP